ncbi:MAG: thiol:disulfide interchange protein DsbA/DsbL [Methylophilaceae bacterium]|nr:MAG: thiol:disulfide interchange protein DsbA/DsbL [Methylophilaceae bacterium]
MKKLWLAFALLLSTMSISTPLLAAPQIGQDFDAVAQTVATENNNKIEVMEIFWYGCSHCYHMEQPLHAWLKQLPDDVQFKRMPGLPNPSWTPMAQTYFTMEALGIVDQLHNKLFEAIHKQKSLNPTDQKAALNWLTSNSGLDRKKVEDTFNSFTVSTNLKRAAQVFRSSGATGVPSLMIDGKYITSGTMAGGNTKALEVVDYIVSNIRATKQKSPTKK